MKARRVKNRDYSMHLLPVDSNAKVILGAFVIHKTKNATDIGFMHVPAVTTNGRISFLPIGTEEDFIRIQRQFRERIEERYPRESYPDVYTYICAAVVLAASHGESMGFISEVWGFTENMPELEQIYQLLVDVVANMDKDRTQVEKFLGSKPVRSWVNELISFLKKEMKWEEYVDQAYTQLIDETEKTP